MKIFDFWELTSKIFDGNVLRMTWRGGSVTWQDPRSQPSVSWISAGKWLPAMGTRCGRWRCWWNRSRLQREGENQIWMKTLLRGILGPFFSYENLLNSCMSCAVNKSVGRKNCWTGAKKTRISNHWDKEYWWLGSASYYIHDKNASNSTPNIFVRGDLKSQKI